MNWWYNNPTYLEETAGGTHETSPTTSLASIQPWNGGALPACGVASNSTTGNSTTVPTATGRWAFCGVVQGANFYSITSALLTSYSTTAAVYGGNALSFRAVNDTSCTGSRAFYNLTQGSSAVLTQNASIVSLAMPGSTGGNTNYFFPFSSPELDGDGLTFNMNVIPIIDGQSASAASGATQAMNFWFTQGQYDEENRGGTHESTPIASSLSITPVPLTTTVYPTCAPATSTQFYFCLVLVAPTYTVQFNGVITAGALAKPYPASSSNQLNVQEQGVVVTAASGGMRTYTNLTTGVRSVVQVTGLVPLSTFIGNATCCTLPARCTPTGTASPSA